MNDYFKLHNANTEKLIRNNFADPLPHQYLKSLVESGSKLAKKWYEDETECILVDFISPVDDKTHTQVGFHPNGLSGCVTLDDDYLYGIRCDHLMWMDGYNESAETQFKGGWFGGDDGAVMIVGNHKGTTCIKFIMKRYL